MLVIDKIGIGLKGPLFGNDSRSQLFTVGKKQKLPTKWP
jgi:hypothetical protein